MILQTKGRQIIIPGILISIVGLLCVIGWLTQSRSLASLGISGNGFIDLSTAIGIFLAGLCMILLRLYNPELKPLWIFLSSAIFLLGLIGIIRFAIYADTFSDLIEPNDKNSGPVYSSGISAVSLAIAGITLTLSFLKKYKRIIQLLSIILINLSLLMLLSFIIGSKTGFAISFFTCYSLQSAIAFFTIGLFILLDAGIFETKSTADWQMMLSIGFVILVLLTSFYLLSKSKEELISSSRDVDHSREVIIEVEKILSGSKDIEISKRSFLATGDSVFLPIYKSAVDSISIDLEKLRKLTDHIHEHRAEVGLLQTILRNETLAADSIINQYSSKLPGNKKKIIQVSASEPFNANLSATLNSIKNTENALLTKKKEIHTNNIDQANRIGIILLGLALFALLIFYRLAQRNQDAILKEKDFSEKIIESLPGVFYLFDKHGKFIWWNKHLEKVTNYSSDEIRNMHPSDFFSKKIRDEVHQKMKEVLKFGASESEGFLRTKNGTKIPFYFTGTFITYNGVPCMLGTGIDISEQKKVEQKLVEERKLLRTLIDNLPDFIYVRDRELKHIINNQANVELLGAESEAETLGKTLHEYFEENVANEFEKDDSAILKSKTPIINKEEKIQVKNGEMRWQLTSKVPVLDDQQNVSMIIGISRDITYRKQTVEALENSIKRFEMIGKTTNDAVWEWDLVTNEIWANEMHQYLYGKDDMDDIPKIDDWETRIHPEDRARIVQRLRETMKSNSNVWIAEYRFYVGKNKERFINIYDRTYILRNADGEPVKMMGSMVDITDRKAAEESLRSNEEKYRLLFNGSPLPMLAYDIENFKILDVNDAAIAQYGYTKSEFLEMSVHDLSPQEDLDNFFKNSVELSAGLTQIDVGRHQKKDKSVIDVEVNSHDIMFNDRKSRLVLVQDITEKLRTQRIILESSEQLRSLSARLQEIREEERMYMAHEIHDELGQRLTVLKMDISWLKKYLKDADTATKQKLDDTINLLDGTIKIVRKIATDLRPGILDDLGLIPALEWQSKDFENRSGIKVSFKANITELALKNELATGLFRIYQEALTNVGRHAEATQIDSTLEKKGEKIILSITDDGIGFDTATLGTKKTLGITGMKERTKIFGGEYFIESSPGKGTRIRVCITVPEEFKR